MREEVVETTTTTTTVSTTTAVNQITTEIGVGGDNVMQAMETDQLLNTEEEKIECEDGIKEGEPEENHEAG